MVGEPLISNTYPQTRFLLLPSSTTRLDVVPSEESINLVDVFSNDQAAISKQDIARELLLALDVDFSTRHRTSRTCHFDSWTSSGFLWLSSIKCVVVLQLALGRRVEIIMESMYLIPTILARLAISLLA
ncbi:hypothetical protein CY34DRAFT_753031 [Suillus luteus UH-Slu-Lm8-n1]|uniref:Uncharacterized protein n=1 Tax=Suillus luteus UH-Slu-Lm8-n1 TaxID=930992 RepID=A0A0D0B8T3_9AGAM|nr:hypothetical protein CY34DRAFT_753031 [Suillus luteus UH-Slu-Lm8-n1]